jgi:hypothetical protein
MSEMFRIILTFLSSLIFFGIFVSSENLTILSNNTPRTAKIITVENNNNNAGLNQIDRGGRRGSVKYTSKDYFESVANRSFGEGYIRPSTTRTTTTAKPTVLSTTATSTTKIKTPRPTLITTTTTATTTTSDKTTIESRSINITSFLKVSSSTTSKPSQSNATKAHRPKYNQSTRAAVFKGFSYFISGTTNKFDSTTTPKAIIPITTNVKSIATTTTSTTRKPRNDLLSSIVKVAVTEIEALPTTLPKNSSSKIKIDTNSTVQQPTTTKPLREIHKNDSRSTVLSAVKINNPSSLSAFIKKDVFTASDIEILNKKNVESTDKSSSIPPTLANKSNQTNGGDSVGKEKQKQSVTRILKKKRIILHETKSNSTVSPLKQENSTEKSTISVLPRTTTIRSQSGERSPSTPTLITTKTSFKTRHRFDIKTDIANTTVHSSTPRGTTRETTRKATSKPLSPTTTTVQPLLIIVDNEITTKSPIQSTTTESNRGSLLIVIDENSTENLKSTDTEVKIDFSRRREIPLEKSEEQFENEKVDVNRIHKIAEEIPVICRGPVQLGVRGKCRFITA